MVTSTAELIFKDVLLPRQEQPIRLSLPEWTTLVMQKYRSAKDQNMANVAICHEITGSFNMLALICVYFGRPDLSEALCRTAINWVGAVVERYGREECYGAAFGPFINLGRLERIRRRPRLALECFNTVRDALARRPVSLGPLRLSERALESVWCDKALGNVVREAFIVDSVKVMLSANMFQELQNFVDDERRSATAEDQLLTEALVIALMCCAEFDAAASAIHTSLESRDRRSAAVMSFRRAELLAAMDQPSAVVKMLVRLVSAASPKMGRNALALMIRVAKLLEACGDTERSRALAIECLESAAALGDIPFQCDSIQLLKLCTDSAEGKEALDQRHIAIKATALWGQANAPRQCQGAVTICDACEELLEFARAY
jgi:hypothetical protein